MARLSEHGLRRTVGVPGLFATAYGNVGSSIYYALGLVAAHALGLTPLVFLVAGGLFALTAKTYAEGASMFPEAGGSSSFARHAFNDSTSFFAGWALSLDYILTIAISAYFVPYYASALPGLQRDRPRAGQHPRRARACSWCSSVLNIRGLGESANLNFILACVDLGDPGAGRDPRRRARAQPVAARQPGAPRHRAERQPADLRRLDRDARLHRHRDGLEHGGGGQGSRARTCRGRSTSC